MVELKGNYLLLDKPTFGSKPSFNLCNVPMEFSSAQQPLHLDLTDYSTAHDDMLLPEWGRSAGKSMALKFSNGHFVRSR